MSYQKEKQSVFARILLTQHPAQCSDLSVYYKFNEIYDDGGGDDTIKLFLLLCTIVSMNKKSKPKRAFTSEKNLMNSKKD